MNGDELIELIDQRINTQHNLADKVSQIVIDRFICKTFFDDSRRGMPGNIDLVKCLQGNAHSRTPGGTMWLNQGTFGNVPEEEFDLDPYIVFDVGFGKVARDDGGVELQRVPARPQPTCWHVE